MSDGPEIREHMAVVGSDGQHVGTVDRLERGGITLTRDDDLNMDPGAFSDSGR